MLAASLLVVVSLLVWRYAKRMLWQRPELVVEAARTSKHRSIWALSSFRRAIATLLIAALALPSLAGCIGRSYSDLPAHVPRAWVCARMPQVEPDARYWAMHTASNTFVSDSDPEAFDEFVPYADIVYIYDSTARAESVHAFPSAFVLMESGLSPSCMHRRTPNSPAPAGRAQTAGPPARACNSGFALNVYQ